MSQALNSAHQTGYTAEILCTSCVLSATHSRNKLFRMCGAWTAEVLSYGQTLYAQRKLPKTRNALITKELVRPAGLEPAAFCSGEKSSMCMLFILQSAQRGCERDLRGIQRLLCTRSSPGRMCTKPVGFSNSENICPFDAGRLPRTVGAGRSRKWANLQHGLVGQLFSELSDVFNKICFGSAAPMGRQILSEHHSRAACLG